MRHPELIITHSSVHQDTLVALAGNIPVARIALKIGTLVLVMEEQGSARIADVLGLTRMSLSRWIHGENTEGRIVPVDPT